jgi:DNA-binding NarL/FixJ family response regulator
MGELTDDERRIIHMLMAGYSDELMAKQLLMSVRTLQRHLRRLMERAGAADRTRFAAIATHRGWVDPDWFRLDA